MSKAWKFVVSLVFIHVLSTIRGSLLVNIFGTTVIFKKFLIFLKLNHLFIILNWSFDGNFYQVSPLFNSKRFSNVGVILSLYKIISIKVPICNIFMENLTIYCWKWCNLWKYVRIKDLVPRKDWLFFRLWEEQSLYWVLINWRFRVLTKALLMLIFLFPLFLF